MTPEKREYNRKWQADNREHLREYRRARAADPTIPKRDRTEYRKAWTERNRERVAAKNAEWYLRLKSDPKRYAEHLAKIRVATKKRPDLRRERDRRWRESHRQAQRTKTKRRKALRKGAQGNYTFAQWQARFSYYGGMCAYCGTKLTIENAHVDHVIALKVGGTNWPSNLVPACCSCNCSKRTSRWLPHNFWELYS